MSIFWPSQLFRKPIGCLFDAVTNTHSRILKNEILSRLRSAKVARTCIQISPGMHKALRRSKQSSNSRIPLFLGLTGDGILVRLAAPGRFLPGKTARAPLSLAMVFGPLLFPFAHCRQPSALGIGTRRTRVSTLTGAGSGRGLHLVGDQQQGLHSRSQCHLGNPRDSGGNSIVTKLEGRCRHKGTTATNCK